MLERLLALIVRGELQSVNDLAEKLEVPASLVYVMLEELERMGYLRKVNEACEMQCAGCENRGICGILAGGTLWSVTERGAQAASHVVSY